MPNLFEICKYRDTRAGVRQTPETNISMGSPWPQTNGPGGGFRVEPDDAGSVSVLPRHRSLSELDTRFTAPDTELSKFLYERSEALAG